ncbi:MAG: ABC transporter ATP-binding protein [Metamycoplasmataceae bacterium]
MRKKEQIINSIEDEIIKGQNNSSGTQIDFVNIGKKYQGRVEYTLDDINFTIEKQELCVILGPSGCGKTTLLRMIAGLNSITKGDLLFDGKRINDLEPSDRDIAMVFQSYALYPHMNVYQNIAFGLKQQKVRKDVIDRRIKDVAKILEITDRLYDKPKDLSGGQRQRVAIARAIVRKPSVFLMDEPLSNLDAKLRESTRRQIVNIHKMIGSTSVYVTHDQLEAMTMANKIILMNKSKIQQIGTPMDLYLRPANIFTAKFIGSPTMNLIGGRIDLNDSSFTSDNEEFKIKINKDLIDESKMTSEKVVLGFRSEDAMRVNELTEHSFALRIVNVEFIGKEKLVVGNSIISKKEISVSTPNWEEIIEGQDIFFEIREDSIHLFDLETKERIN